MSIRTVFEYTLTPRTASTVYDGKTVKAADLMSLDKALDELGAPRPRRFEEKR